MMHLEFNNSIALLSIYGLRDVNVHLGIKPYKEARVKKGREVEGLWAWGKVSEVNDSALKSFGLGPLALIAWIRS